MDVDIDKQRIGMFLITLSNIRSFQNQVKCKEESTMEIVILLIARFGSMYRILPLFRYITQKTLHLRICPSFYFPKDRTVMSVA